MRGKDGRDRRYRSQRGPRTPTPLQEDRHNAQLIQTVPACTRLAMLSACETSRLNTAAARPYIVSLALCTMSLSSFHSGANGDQPQDSMLAVNVYKAHLELLHDDNRAEDLCERTARSQLLTPGESTRRQTHPL